MYREIIIPPPFHGWNKSNLNRYRKRQAQKRESGFICQQCGAYVYSMEMASGVQNRNHCPFCLWSRHVDHFKPGDRLSACKAKMRPIGLTVKPTRNKYARNSCGELMLIHQCNDCGKLSINRLAADDLTEVLRTIYHASLNLDEPTRNLLEQAGIHPLINTDEAILLSQLYGLLQLE